MGERDREMELIIWLGLGPIALLFVACAVALVIGAARCTP